MDVQYERTLVETGIVGLAVFLWLAWSALKSSLAAFRALRDPEERGLALGFLAGTIGLLVHAVGANTFIIVRSEEHTSELQSRPHLVCRLLLEKKKRRYTATYRLQFDT